MQLRPSEGRTLQFEILDDSRTRRLLEMKGVGSCDARKAFERVATENFILTGEREAIGSYI